MNWLQSRPLPINLLEEYSKRYGVSRMVARDELMEAGYYDELEIQEYEKKGIKWEYQVEPLSGEMYVVPKGTEEHELYEIHQITTG